MSQQFSSQPEVGGSGIAVGANEKVPGTGPGGGNLGPLGIVGLMIYLVLFTLFLIYGLVKVWPVPTPSRETADAHASPTPTPTRTSTAGQTPIQTPERTQSPAPTPSATAVAVQASPSPTVSPSPAASSQPEPVTITFLAWQFKLWDEQRLLLLVLFAGALGSILHDLRSAYWYIGNRKFVRSWIAMSLVLPFAGATLALIFYLVVRGGFFSPQSSFKETSPFGFAAFAALIGMFSPQAVLKLKEVAETLLTKPGTGANAQPQTTVAPSSPPPPPAAPPPRESST
jgi:hypothetical protein